MKIKLITGYRKDQTYSVEAEEAHKAYYLWFNPDTRTVFSDGLAIKGSEIEIIEPDYQGSMGWNPTHTLDGDDMNEIRTNGLDRKLRQVMYLAGEIAKIGDEKDIVLSLSEVAKKYPQLGNSDDRMGGTGDMKRIGPLPIK